MEEEDTEDRSDKFTSELGLFSVFVPGDEGPEEGDEDPQ